MKHYVLLPYAYSTQAVMDSVLAQEDRIDGFGRRYFLRELHDGRRFTLAALLDDFNYAAERGKQIVPMFVDKTFADPPPYNQNPLPPHLEHLVQPNANGGLSSFRWHPDLRAFMADLVEHMNWLDGHPGFGGLLLQETAIGLSNPEEAGYSSTEYLEAYRELFEAGQMKMYWQANFIPGANKTFYAEALHERFTGNAIGGPDFLLEDEALVKTTFPQWAEARKGGAELFVGISPPCYQQSLQGKRLELDRMIELARERGFQTLFWSYKPFGAVNITHALQAIGADRGN